MHKLLRLLLLLHEKIYPVRLVDRISVPHEGCEFLQVLQVVQPELAVLVAMRETLMDDQP